MTVRELVEKYALDIVFSSTNGHRFDFIMENLELGELPDGVVPWYPYQDVPPEDLVQEVTGYEDMFTCFIEDLEALV